MYSFKYHLVSLCAVFLALAVGMLLGAAVGGSELLSNTTTDMVESLTEKFAGMTEENEQLELSGRQNASLAGAYVDQWQQDRLKDRSVLIISGATAEQDNASQEVAGYVQGAGGRCVTMKVIKPSFGIDDEETMAELAKVLPEVPGRDYRDVLAEALAAEWTAGVQEEGSPVFDGGRISTGGEVSEADRRLHPVTTALVDVGAISIAGSSSVPDSITGCINVAIEEEQPAAASADETVDDGAEVQDGEGDGDEAVSAEPRYLADSACARMGSALDAKGVAVVFTQEADCSGSLMDEASARDVAGVSSCAGVIGRYSVIQLLATGASGVYGPDRDAAFWYPAL